MIKEIYAEQLITPAKVLRRHKLVIKRGRIAAIKRFTSFPRGKSADRICARDGIATPGFIDLHIQGCAGADFLDTTEESVERILRVASRHGVTGLLATVTICRHDRGLRNFARLIEILKDKVRSFQQGARPLGIHLEGPYINPELRGGFGKDYVRTATLAEFKRVYKITGDFMKLLTIAPEMGEAKKIIRFALNKGVKVALGHSNADYDLASRMFHRGANHVTHLFNAMAGFHHRQPGLVGAALLQRGVFVQVIPDGIHLHPLTLRTIVKLKGVGEVVLISDATAACASRPGTVFQGVGGKIRIKDGGVRLEDGTLAGSALMLDKGVRLMKRYAELELPEVVRMVTLNPARALGLRRKGEVVIGQDADLVVVNRNLKVLHTIREGNLIYSSAP